MLKGTASASPHSVVRAPLLPRVQRCLAASVTPLFWRALLGCGVCARAFLYLNKEGPRPLAPAGRPACCSADSVTVADAAVDDGDLVFGDSVPGVGR